ncbi:hypothetical protein QYM36_016827 [Artemia franciscana]|uniref:Uncharacterized protein n=1 Tax=Artemia franciscana TaxID=6661 RepID=A0AA88H4B3_ARTSF|nr:hypothetical protein QYM36_016827 [Artemia franciscana]
MVLRPLEPVLRPLEPVLRPLVLRPTVLRPTVLRRLVLRPLPFIEKQHLNATTSQSQMSKHCVVAYSRQNMLSSSAEIPTVVTGGSFFSRGSRVRYSGRVERELSEDLALWANRSQNRGYRGRIKAPPLSKRAMTDPMIVRQGSKVLFMDTIDHNTPVACHLLGVSVV